MAYRSPELSTPSLSPNYRLPQQAAPIIDSREGADMEASDQELIVSLSEFKRQTAAVLTTADHRPIAVQRDGKAFFYVMDPLLYEAIMDDLADQAAYKKTLERLSEKSTLIEVDLDDL